MSQVYTVYAHPTEGAWGFSGLTPSGSVSTAYIEAATHAVLVKDIEPLKVAPAIQKLLRKGFTKVAQAKYLYARASDGACRGEFVSKHPDLGQQLGVECLMFAGVPTQVDMRELARDFELRLADASGGDHQRQVWLQHVSSVSTYMPVFNNGDAHAALLVAQWAREECLVLMTNKGSLPFGSAKEQRYEWRNFLQEWFDRTCIDRAFSELGWPLAGALCVAREANSSTDPDAGGWLAMAQQVAF